MGLNDVWALTDVHDVPLASIDANGVMTTKGLVVNGTTTNNGVLASTAALVTATVGLAAVGLLRVYSYSPGSPALGATTAVHAAVTDNGSPQTITTAITNPDIPRNVTATAGGTSTDIKAIAVVVTGTDINDAVLTETLPVFTVDTAGTVVGSKAFKTVTSIAIPAHDGTGATTAVGTGAKIGLPAKLATNTVLLASLGGTREGTAPTVATSSTVFASNTATLNSALNATAVVLYFLA